MSHTDRANHNGHGHPHTRRWIVACELKAHAPFTALGALTGVGLMALVAVSHLPHETSEHVFHIMHPLHVLFSAIVTTGLYWRYKRRLVPSILIGYVGSIGIGTLSDILLPHLGGILVGAEMHAVHIGFIDHWYIVNPLALAGVGVALWRPHTKLPHMGHVLLSTWASLFYLTAHGEAVWLPLLPAIFAVLFVAVWVPCCLSDIAFPLLFVGRRAAAEEVQEH